MSLGQDEFESQRGSPFLIRLDHDIIQDDRNRGWRIAKMSRESLQCEWFVQPSRIRRLAHLLSKTQAQRKAAEYQQKANAPSAPSGDSHLTVAGLAEHYSERELGEKSDKTMRVRKAYLLHPQQLHPASMGQVLALRGKGRRG
jgi:hypothetical protein